jgi:hypothetical protein
MILCLQSQKTFFSMISGVNPQEPALTHTSPQLPAGLGSSPCRQFWLHKFVNTERYPMSLKNSINHLPPERMTPEQRRLEIAAILAKGLVRLRQSSPVKRQIPATERKVLLGFSGDQSVHTDLINK